MKKVSLVALLIAALLLFIPAVSSASSKGRAPLKKNPTSMKAVQEASAAVMARHKGSTDIFDLSGQQFWQKWWGHTVLATVGTDGSYFRKCEGKGKRRRCWNEPTWFAYEVWVKLDVNRKGVVVWQITAADDYKGNISSKELAIAYIHRDTSFELDGKDPGGGGDF